MHKSDHSSSRCLTRFYSLIIMCLCHCDCSNNFVQPLMFTFLVGQGPPFVCSDQDTQIYLYVNVQVRNMCSHQDVQPCMFVYGVSSGSNFRVSRNLCTWFWSGEGVMIHVFSLGTAASCINYQIRVYFSCVHMEVFSPDESYQCIHSPLRAVLRQTWFT